MANRLRQAIQPTTIVSVATTNGGTPCRYSRFAVTVASAANITVQPSTAPHSRVWTRTNKTAAVNSSDPVTKWNQRGYPHFKYSSMIDSGATMLLSDPTKKKAARKKGIFGARKFWTFNIPYLMMVLRTYGGLLRQTTAFG